MKTLLITLLFLVSYNNFAQDNDRRERIKALKVAYITEQLELSKTEAEQFWPVYNTFEEQEHKLKKESYNKRKNLNIESISEDDAKKIIDEMVISEAKKQTLHQNFIKDLQKILPSKKIIKLKIAEDEFNKKMFEEYKKRKDSNTHEP